MLYNDSVNNRSNIVIGVMRGGPSPEYEVSLKTGANVLSALRGNDRYKVRDIFIDRAGRWHIDGLERSLESVLPHLDLVFNALHGAYGEDGRVQQILDAYNVPYTGSKSLPSALGMNKWLSKKIFRDNKLNTPRGVVSDKKQSIGDSTVRSLLKDFGGIVVVKPLSAGSSVGVSVVRTPSEFSAALNFAFEHSDKALIEEYIAGREATVATLEGSEPGALHALPPIEVRNKSASTDFWNYESKYSDDLHDLICPGDFSAGERFALEDAAIRAHKALGLSHYSRSDFILNPRGIYILETNSLPGLTSASLVPVALKAAGVHFHEFLNHIIDLAMLKR